MIESQKFSIRCLRVVIELAGAEFSGENFDEVKTNQQSLASKVEDIMVRYFTDFTLQAEQLSVKIRSHINNGRRRLANVVLETMRTPDQGHKRQTQFSKVGNLAPLPNEIWSLILSYLVPARISFENRRFYGEPVCCGRCQMSFSQECCCFDIPASGVSVVTTGCICSTTQRAILGVSFNLRTVAIAQVECAEFNLLLQDAEEWCQKVAKRANKPRAASICIHRAVDWSLKDWLQIKNLLMSSSTKVTVFVGTHRGQVCYTLESWPENLFHVETGHNLLPLEGLSLLRDRGYKCVHCHTFDPVYAPANQPQPQQ